MPENRVIVWVQNRGDRPYLSLEWHDPATNKRRSKSAETNNPVEADLRHVPFSAAELAAFVEAVWPLVEPHDTPARWAECFLVALAGA